MSTLAYRFFPAMLIFIMPFQLFPQQQKSKMDYSYVDSFSATIKYKNNIYQLTGELTNPFSQDLFKARAIFKWITNNIRYDYKYYNKYAYRNREPKTYKCRDDKNCEAKRLAWETEYINRVLRKKKAVCQGYAMLFKKMCDIAGLKSQLIPGYVRTEYYQVGTTGTLNHAWNAVFLDSTYYLLDATWAAGGCWKNDKGKLMGFQQNYKDYYWLTPAGDIARDHYPRDSTWRLLPGLTREKFSANPYYAPDIISDIKLITPASGIISAIKGDTIRFKFTYTGYFKDLQVNSNIFRNPDIWIWEGGRKGKRRLDTLAVRKQQYIQYRRNDDQYEFDYVVTDNSLYYLDIVFDARRVMRFKVVVGK